MRTVGAYEAKTHLPRLLEEVERGETVVITRHGAPVAMLGPPPGRGRAPSAVIAAMRESRRGISLGGISLRELIEEGRR